MKEKKIIEKNLLQNTKQATNELRNLIFDIIKKQKQNDLNDIIDQFTKVNKKEKIEKIIEEVKKDGYFTIQKILNNNQGELLELIFNNIILHSEYYSIKNKLSEYLSEDELFSVYDELQAITEFCIRNNRSGIYFTQVLVESYDVKKDLAEKIGNDFTNNIIELKLNYIIENIAKN